MVLEHWPERPLRGSLSSSQGGLFRVKVLTESSCPYSRCPWCRPSCLHAHLQSETCVLMPRRHNNTYDARVKRHQIQRDTQCPQEAKNSAAAAAEEEDPSSPSSGPQGSPPSSPAAGESHKLQGALALALLMQGLPVQDLMKEPRAQRKKVQVPPRQPWPLRAFSMIL